MADARLDRDGPLRNALQNVGLWALSCGFFILLVATLFKDTEFFKTEIIKTLSNEIAFALLIAAILVLTTEKRSRLEFNRLMTDHITKLDKTIARDLSEVYGTMRLAKFPDDVERSSVASQITEIGKKIYDEYIQGLIAIPGGFHLEDVSWALESNKIFYQIIHDSGCTDGEVRITHTGTIDTWLNFEKAGKTLEQQRRFIQDKNMKIIRIFIGRDDLSVGGNQIAQYIEVMKNMRKYGIKCCYVRDINPAGVIDMTWVPRLHLLSVWMSGVGGGVGSIEVTSDNSRPDLKDEWESLLHRDQFESYDQTTSLSRQS
jgi:hypothetical protein